MQKLYLCCFKTIHQNSEKAHENGSIWIFYNFCICLIVQKYGHRKLSIFAIKTMLLSKLLKGKILYENNSVFRQFRRNVI